MPSDVRVRRTDVSGTRIHAHRNILAARSDYFSNMFGSQCREAQPGAVVTVGETTPAAFKKLLAYLYSDELELDDEVVVDVRSAASPPPPAPYSLGMGPLSYSLGMGPLTHCWHPLLP
jgi:hypothetical protein